MVNQTLNERLIGETRSHKRNFTRALEKTCFLVPAILLLTYVPSTIGTFKIADRYFGNQDGVATQNELDRLYDAAETRDPAEIMGVYLKGRFTK